MNDQEETPLLKKMPGRAASAKNLCEVLRGMPPLSTGNKNFFGSFLGVP